MPRRQRARLTLTNRLLLLSSVLVLTTTLLVAGTSASGVYEMARGQQAARQSAYRDVIAAEIGKGLDIALGRLQKIALHPGLQSDDQAEVRGAVSSSAVEGAAQFERFVLLDGGGVLTAWPDDGVGASAAEELDAAEASAAVLPFIWQDGAGEDGSGILWALAGLTAADGSPRLLMGQVRTGFVDEALASIAVLHSAPRALVFDVFGHVEFQSAHPPVTAVPVLEFVTDPDQPSTGEVYLDGPVTLVGPYTELRTARELGWKVAVVESPDVAWQETWAALAPGALGWVFALLVALIISLAVLSWMLQPLKHLEDRARALASGVAGEPEVVDEYDELGRLVEAFNSIGRRLSRMQDIAELLARASDRSLMLAGITSAIAHMLGAVDAEVLLLGDEGRLDLVAAEGALAVTGEMSIALADVPWIAKAISSGQPVEAPVGANDPYLDLHADGSSSALAAPLRAGADIIGVAVVVRRGGRAFSEAEKETVRTFAAQAAVALQNSRLFEDERSSRKEAESLRAVAERAVAAGDVDELLLDIARMQAELVGFGEPRLVLADRSSYGLQPPEGVSAEGSWMAVWETLASHRSEPIGPLYATSDDAEPTVAEALRGQGFSAALLTPLYRSDVLAGLLVLVSDTAMPPPSERKLVLAGTVGKQASLALENAYLYQQAKRRADNLETIFRISHAVGSSLQSRVVLNRVLDVVQKILAADAVMLMTYDTQRKHIVVPMARGILNREMLEATFRPGEDVPGRVFETREPERYDRISSSDTRLLSAASEEGLESLLAVPLLARGRSIGVLTVFSSEPAAFTTDELDLLRTFASQAALAIDTAEMFSREHKVATTLQESILPTRLPHIPGIMASSVYLPAGTDADIGGDYYDLFEATDGRVVVSIGDVCGKGVAAATKTAMIRHALRGMAVAGLEPARMMAELNAMLLEIGDATSIVTLWLGYLDTVHGRLLYADGGHPAALLRHPEDGRIERLATTGALLGAVPDIEWDQVEVQLEHGSMLLLYTDGVTEARRAGRFFGEGRVRRALRAGGTPAAVAQRLLGQVQRFAAGDLRDDAAILTVSYRTPGLPDSPSVSDSVSGGK